MQLGILEFGEGGWAIRAETYYPPFACRERSKQVGTHCLATLLKARHPWRIAPLYTPCAYGPVTLTLKWEHSGGSVLVRCRNGAVLAVLRSEKVSAFATLGASEIARL